MADINRNRLTLFLGDLDDLNVVKIPIKGLASRVGNNAKVRWAVLVIADGEGPVPSVPLSAEAVALARPSAEDVALCVEDDEL